MTQTTDYQKQATDFLQSTNTEFSCQFVKTGKYFDDDKDERDIYQIELKRGRRSYAFTFGQSLNDSGFYYTKGVKKYYIDRSLLDKKNLGAYLKTKDWDFMNNGKSDKIHYPEAPTPYDVLACLTKYDPGTFEDFCGEFGYDTDSKKAEKTYLAVLNEWKNVCAMFTDEEIEKLAEIQ